MLEGVGLDDADRQALLFALGELPRLGNGEGRTNLHALWG